MSKQEKWDEIVKKIDDLGFELQEIFDESTQSSEVETSLMGLRMTVDELSEQEIVE